MLTPHGTRVRLRERRIHPGILRRSLTGEEGQLSPRLQSDDFQGESYRSTEPSLALDPAWTKAAGVFLVPTGQGRAGLSSRAGSYVRSCRQGHTCVHKAVSLQRQVGFSLLLTSMQKPPPAGSLPRSSSWLLHLYALPCTLEALCLLLDFELLQSGLGLKGTWMLETVTVTSEGGTPRAVMRREGAPGYDLTAGRQQHRIQV